MDWSFCIDSVEVGGLERSFQEEEVLQNFLSMDGDKTPGFDGFTIALLRSCWAIVKDDLMHVLIFMSTSCSKRVSTLHLVLSSSKRLGSWE
jgi:hypothetical protein